MTRHLPPLDLHAHVNPRIRPLELEQLGSVVFAVTRSLQEYRLAKDRYDQVTVWGVGCHPADDQAQASYDPTSFAALINTTAYVGEIGLDKRSNVSPAKQEEVFISILSILQRTPRIASIHSAGLADRVLQILENRQIKGAVLHWWRGNDEQTIRAIKLGCWFSVNAAGMSYRDHIARIPLNRLLTETDHPSGDRKSPPPRQPGAVADVETTLAHIHNRSAEAVREHIWSNFVQLAEETEVESLLPIPIQRMVAHAKSNQDATYN